MITKPKISLFTLLCGTLLLITCRPCRAQTIVNTYDLIKPMDSLWSATTELQGTFAAGNGVFAALNSGLGLGRQLGEKVQIWTLGGYNFASESGNSIYTTWFGNGRLHYIIDADRQLQLFYQNQYNSALQIDGRLLVGMNYTQSLHSKRHTYNFTLGAFNEIERYTDKTDKRLQRANCATSITTDLSTVDVNLTLYYQPAFNDLSDFRMLGELSLQFPISEQLVFEVESALRYDSDPHMDLLPLDFATLIGMVYSISK